MVGRADDGGLAGFASTSDAASGLEEGVKDVAELVFEETTGIPDSDVSPLTGAPLSSRHLALSAAARNSRRLTICALCRCFSVRFMS